MSQKNIVAAAKRILRPLVRLLIRKGIPSQVLEEAIRETYVEVAGDNFAIESRKPNNSRIAVLTGLSRKEVLRLQTKSNNQGPGNEGQVFYNRAARVLTAWQREPRYCNAKGEPAVLAIEGGERSFAGLVREHSGDMTTRAVLDELLRVGAVGSVSGKRVKMLAQGYVPARDEEQILHILGEDTALLIGAISHNLEAGGANTWFQKKVMYTRVPKSVIPKFKKIVRERGQATLEELDRFLNQHDLGGAKGQGVEECISTGVGVYYFEDKAAKEST